MSHLAFPATAIWRSRALLASAVALAMATSSWAQNEGEPYDACGPTATPYHYGPFDYRTQKSLLRIVEVRHFTPGVEWFTRPSTSSDYGDDINYTLLASPNHARALAAVIRLEERLKNPQPPGLDYPVSCYPERAVRYAPDDTVVRLMYAEYLRKHGKREEALRQTDIALTFAGDNPITHFNVGLIYFQLEAYDKALKEAHEARKLGWPRTDLEDSLKKVGKWQEPAP